MARSTLEVPQCRVGSIALIVVDATPLASGHAVRGIGRYLLGVISALAMEQPAFAQAHIRLLVASSQTPPPVHLQTATTFRAAIRPQDVGWAVAVVADRLAARHLRPNSWHQTDPMLPWSPISGSRTVATGYDLIPLHEPAVWQMIRPHRRLLYRAYLDGLRRAHSVVAISAATAADLHHSLGISHDRIHVVPPAITPRAAADPLSLDPDAPALLFVGVMDPHKRPELALETLAALRRRRPAASLSFVGPSPGTRVAALRQHAADIGVADAVRFRGALPDDELVALYRRSILLSISRIEGFGLPPVEAVLNGGRAVAVPITIYKEVLSDAATYASDDGPVAIADAVEASLAGTITEGARGALAARVAPELVAARLRDVYEGLGS